MTIQDPFSISFHKSGGFAGISTGVEVDSESLSPDEAEEVRQLIERSGFFELREQGAAPGTFPDQLQYSITIQYRGKQQTATLNESAVSDNLRPLINYLARKARSKKRD